MRRDERGIAMSSPIALLSAAAVVVAGVAFFSTGGKESERPVETAKPVQASTRPEAVSTSTAPVQVIKKKHKRHHRAAPVVRRSGVYVEVYNNSGITGLAGSTAARASRAGWDVVGSDNWYGTIAASTVYYPSHLAAEAKLLARDLGIGRVLPAIAPMRDDRLTVILTSDYA